MTSLKVLDASFNALEGSLPAMPSSLEQLYLDHNHLTGQIPYALGMGQLRCWSIDNNPGVCGPVPGDVPCFSPLGTNLGKVKGFSMCQKKSDGTCRPVACFHSGVFAVACCVFREWSLHPQLWSLCAQLLGWHAHPWFVAAPLEALHTTCWVCCFCLAGLDCYTNQTSLPGGSCVPLPGTSPPAGYYSSPYPSSPPPPSTSPPPFNMQPGYYPGPPPQPTCDPGRIPDMTAQGRVLMEWRDSMRGWGSNALLGSWGTGDPCVFGWGGVLCESGTVIGIRLQPANNPPEMVTSTWAQGPINWEVLTNLTSLQILELQGLSDNFGAGSSGGNMSGSAGGNMYAQPQLPPLPDAFKSLLNLTVLNISSSRFGSSLPASWSALTKLQVLDVSNTMSWGSSLRSIPGSWCSMSALQVLRAQQAGLQGTLDTLPITGACMPSLRVLQLGGNRDINGTLPPGVPHSPASTPCAGSCNMHGGARAASASAYFQSWCCVGNFRVPGIGLWCTRVCTHRMQRPAA
jgi:Leucine-rich repeat (LRR) protein